MDFWVVVIERIDVGEFAVSQRFEVAFSGFGAVLASYVWVLAKEHVGELWTETYIYGAGEVKTNGCTYPLPWAKAFHLVSTRVSQTFRIGLHLLVL